jgi:putative Holliday junction resolvase
MKSMGIDFGMARIGIALSDETKFLATPFETYKRKNKQEDLNHIINIIKERNVDEIVCGLPYNMQGEEQDIAQRTRDFMNELLNLCSIKVAFVDERLSSIMAEEMLKSTERDWKKRKEKLDAVAASIILQDYLDSK